jgi:Nucleotidyl transferase AbiEii toxin, Type IV TA system
VSYRLHSRSQLGRVPPSFQLGPVLSLEDVAGGKVCALASRVEPRDYADTARMLDHFSPAELIDFAQRLDPGLSARDFADAGQHLDQIDDEAFSRYGLGPGEVEALRERFVIWPRTIDAASRAMLSRAPQNRLSRQDEPNAASARRGSGQVTN